jgi:hypothetical protein
VVRVKNQSEARATVEGEPHSIAIVERGKPRSVVFRCPCDCGEVLSINIDRLAGRAWRLRVDSHGVTLLPSVWRTTGCKSHFVLWANRVWWCRFGSDDDADPWPTEMDSELRKEWNKHRTLF